MTSVDMFKLGMRRLASGVSLITTRDEAGKPHGLIATSVTSVSAEPPTLLVCVNKNVSCYSHIDEMGIFCVNFLSNEDNEVASRFSSSAMRDSRFETGDWQELTTGAPALAGSLASFDCKVAMKVDANSHTIFIGEVVDVRLWAEEISPLIYVNGQYARCA